MKNSKAHASFLQHETVDVMCPSVRDGDVIIAEATIVQCLTVKERKNRNSQLWIKLEPKALEYITRMIAFQAKDYQHNATTTIEVAAAAAATAADHSPEVQEHDPDQKRPRIFEAFTKGAAK